MSNALTAAPVSFNRELSLAELERSDWGEPTYGSHVVTASYKYRQLPVGELETEQLRMLIGQAIGMPFLVHVLLDVLDRDPWAAGDFFEGDLIVAAVRSQNHLFWLANPLLLRRLLDIIARMGAEQNKTRVNTFARSIRAEAAGLERALNAS